jgi:hypothetical protein
VLTKRSVASPRKRTSAPAKAAKAATDAATDFAAGVPAAASAAVAKLGSSSRSRFVGPAILAILAVAIVAGGWWAISAMSTGGNTPDAAALRMMNAYAVYDAKGFLDNVTKASLTATDVASYEAAAASLKADNKDKPQVKDIKVLKVTIDPANPDQATVQLSEQILDPVKGTYAPRTDTLSMVKQNGKWLVRLY